MGFYINDLIGVIRTESGLTYEQIAARLGITRKTLGRWRELEDAQVPLRAADRIEKAFPEFVMEKMHPRHSSIDLMRPEMLMALLQKDKLKVDDMINRAANIFAHKLQIVLNSYAVYKQSRCGGFPTSYLLKIQKLTNDKKVVYASIKVSLALHDYVISITNGDTIVFGATLTDSAIIKAIKRIKGLFK